MATSGSYTLKRNKDRQKMAKKRRSGSQSHEILIRTK